MGVVKHPKPPFVHGPATSTFSNVNAFYAKERKSVKNFVIAVKIMKIKTTSYWNEASCILYKLIEIRARHRSGYTRSKSKNYISSQPKTQPKHDIFQSESEMEEMDPCFITIMKKLFTIMSLISIFSFKLKDKYTYIH